MNPINQELPYELKKYISERVSKCIEANSYDNKPTSQTEIDNIASTSIRLYYAGQEMIKSLESEDKADIERCMRLYLQDKGNRANTANNLVQDKVLGRWVITYQYITLIEKMRQLRAVVL